MKPLNAATGQVLAPYRPCGRHGRRRRHPDDNTKQNYLLASDYRTFLLTKAISNRGTKRTPYSAHRSNELRRLQSGHGCSQRAQLVGVTLGRLRGQKLAEKIIFFGCSKKSGRRHATIAVKLLKNQKPETFKINRILDNSSPEK